MRVTFELLSWKEVSVLEFTPYYLPFLANSFHCRRITCLGHCMLSWQLGNCSRKREMTNIIFMEVTALVIVQKTVDASLYLNAVFLGEVLKNEIIKEGKKGPLRSQTEKYCTEKIKIGLNTAILAKNYEFCFFNWRYSVLFLLSPISHTSLGSQICFELLVCLHRLSTRPEDFHFCQLQWEPFLETFALLEGKSYLEKWSAPVAVVLMSQVDMLKQHQNQAHFGCWSFVGTKKVERWYMTEELNTKFA